MDFLSGQSGCVLKPWYTGGGPEQGFHYCFADRLNPLNPNIKIEILICCPYSFPIEVAGEVGKTFSNNSSCVIMSLILMTTLFYKALSLH